MRVSSAYKIGLTQPALDFVDVDLNTDTPVFVDPRALLLLETEWSQHCVSLIQNFFSVVLDAIRDGRHARAQFLLRQLREPNETRLGFSKGRPQGRALGPESARGVWEALSRSEAVRTGLLEDLEDTILMVEGIGPDIVSDIATNIIRRPLIQYTQRMCDYYDIKASPGVNSGPLWNPATKSWELEFTSLPVLGNHKLILVPKSIVRLRMEFDAGEYYRNFILTYLQRLEMSANTELVTLLRSGRPRVYKKDVAAKYGKGKSTAIRITLEHPQILDSYRAYKRANIRPPLDHLTLAEATGTATPNWDELLEAVVTIPAGHENADRYHRAVEALLSALFHPALVDPHREFPLHDGRKRIDITYTNLATFGFFKWLKDSYPAAHVFVECKNYSTDPDNPAVDQLAGRFSPSRGRFGFLVSRKVKDKPTLFQRCRDTADDDRGFIIPLDDDDLTELVDSVRQGGMGFRDLKRRFDKLIM